MHAFQPPPERSHAARPRILICDPSAKARQHLHAALGGDAEHVMVESGEEALRVAATGFPPDLMLVAVELPGLDGYELCRRARATERLDQVPIILLIPPRATDDARAQALESGADDSLCRPVRPRELRARTAALLRMRFMAAALEARTRELETANRFLTQARVALVQSEKQATIGTLVSGVAQQVNNPLTFIHSGVASLRDYLGSVVSLTGQLMATPDGDREALSRKLSEAILESKEVLEEIGEGAQRLEQISKDLWLIAADTTPEVEEVDVEEEIERAWKVVQLRTRRRPELVMTADRFQHVRTSGPLLHQVLMNVLLNAVQALDSQGGGGTIWVSSQELDGEVVVTVRDSGPGIPERLINRIFDPFFTTRPGGQGAGLGLSVSESIMRNLGGSIEASSTEGRGATFTLRLPAARAAEGYVLEEPLG
ncbi:MAG TPA: ATP-binding protein [Myxococcales bacterium]|nr:ATP-binding protein [Myxococcales bacterium]